MKPIGGLVTLGTAAVDLRTGIGTIDAGDISTVHSLVLRAGTANGDVVYVGDISLTTAADAMMVLEAGDGLGFDIPAGDYVDLESLYALAASSGDTLYVFGIQ